MTTKEKSDVYFFVEGTPVPKERARTFSRYNKQGRWSTSTVTPGRTRAWEQAIAWQARAAGPSEPWAGPVALGVVVHVRIPKSWPLKKKEAARCLELLPFASGGDLSNYTKAVEDGGERVLWVNDKQIVQYCPVIRPSGTIAPMGKVYSETPGIEVYAVHLKP